MTADLERSVDNARMRQITGGHAADMTKLLDLCKDRWLTRNEIATLVHRNSESLRQRYINPMVEHGLLRLRYPEKPNRTDQAYTTAINNA